MPDTSTVARSELILGGQRSGKSRRAELLARQWLDADPRHTAVLIATAQPWDAEMAERIARHRLDRAARAPGLATAEEPRELAAAIARYSQPGCLVVVDCLTLWLTNLLMPPEMPQESQVENNEQNRPPAQVNPAQDAPVSGAILAAVLAASGPLVLVSNEIGLGVIPMGREVRAFVDALGRLNQEAAQACTRVTLMAAGLPLTLKDERHDAT